MNVKLLSHLIMAHVLSGWWWWSVLGDENVFDSKDQKLLTEAKEHPKLYQSVRDRLIVHNAKYEGLEKLFFKVNDENKKIDTYVKVVQGVKIRDWIVEAERNFPNWLSFLDVNRFIKWVLALKFVEAPFFVNLRRLLEERKISIETFANHMHSLYEDMSALVAHNLPGIPKPTPDTIPQVCEIVAGDDRQKNDVCNVLLHGLLTDGTAVSTKVTTTPDPHPTKFYVIITHYKKTNAASEQALNKMSSIAESTPEFRDQKCELLEKFVIDHSKLYNTQFGKQKKLNLPTLVMRIGFPKNLRGVSPEEFEKNFEDLKSVMKKIGNGIKDDDKTAEIFIQDEFISHEWFRSLVNPSDTNDSGEPPKGQNQKTSKELSDDQDLGDNSND